MLSIQNFGIMWSAFLVCWFPYVNLLLLSSTTFSFTTHSRNYRHSFSRYALSVPHENRFDREASSEAQVEVPCVISIGDKLYNLTAWAKAHPGGVKVLQKYHGKDATRAFNSVGHSRQAVEMMKDFEVPLQDFHSISSDPGSRHEHHLPPKPLWRVKLFTKEDPIGLHKYCGIFVLLHFAGRYFQMLFGDPSAGFGSRLGKGPSCYAPLCLIPHVMLSLSSLIFHSVPKERVVGKPMIWQEYRIHNIAFAMRSILATFITWLSIYSGNGTTRSTIVAVSLVVLVTQAIADEATNRLRVNCLESTTATMPYWANCSAATQRRFKSFYAMCQFDATLACLAVSNPAWGLAVLLPIQLASLLMTLVRKSLLSPQGYHIGYTLSLIVPYLVAYRSIGMSATGLLGLGWVLYQLRRQGINKYALWIPVIVARIAIGNNLFQSHVW